MKIRPILMSTPMVQAILDGRKTMTRRIAKRIPEETHRVEQISDNEFEAYWGGYVPDLKGFVDGSTIIKSPYQPGDILWVQETWKVIRLLENMQMQFEYRADGVISKTIDFLLDRFTKFKKFADKNGWQSPYFMPREAARIFLRFTNVRVERLQDITEEDAQAEGVGDLFLEEIGYSGNPKYDLPMEGKTLAREQFELLWDSINAKRGYGWDTNPWVWVYEFERVDKP
jgi:hypothetical protein